MILLTALLEACVSGIMVEYNILYNKYRDIVFEFPFCLRIKYVCRLVNRYYYGMFVVQVRCWYYIGHTGCIILHTHCRY